MTFPTIFANLAAGTQPASLLDTMFNICGGMGNIPTTSVGTNSIALTPVTNFYQPAAYANYQIVSWKQAATTTGNVTVQLGALAPVKLFMPSGVQASSGDLVVNAKVVAMFASDLDGGAGGFVVINATTPSVVQPVQGEFKNLLIVNGASPDTQVAVTADEIMLENPTGGAAKVGGAGAGVSFTILTGVSGVVNGLDTGSIANNTFYSVWCIFNGSTVGGLLSLSATNPTMPAGYTWKARIGWARTGAASTNLHRIRQVGRRAQYVVTPASQTTAFPIILNGGATTGAWTSLTAVGASSFLPVTATEIYLAGFVSITTNTFALAPNGNFGTPLSTTNAAPLNGQGGTAGNAVANGSFVLEGTTIFYYTTHASTFVFVSGWVDNL